MSQTVSKRIPYNARTLKAVLREISAWARNESTMIRWLPDPKVQLKLPAGFKLLYDHVMVKRATNGEQSEMMAVFVRNDGKRYIQSAIGPDPGKQLQDWIDAGGLPMQAANTADQ